MWAIQDIKSAAQFYENKVGEVGGSVKELEAIVQTKSNNLRVVEEGKIACLYPSEEACRGWQLTSSYSLVLRQKLAAPPPQAPTP